MAVDIGSTYLHLHGSSCLLPLQISSNPWRGTSIPFTGDKKAADKYDVTAKASDGGLHSDQDQYTEGWK